LGKASGTFIVVIFERYDSVSRGRMIRLITERHQLWHLKIQIIEGDIEPDCVSILQ